MSEAKSGVYPDLEESRESRSRKIPMLESDREESGMNELLNKLKVWTSRCLFVKRSDRARILICGHLPNQIISEVCIAILVFTQRMPY